MCFRRALRVLILLLLFVICHLSTAREVLLLDTDATQWANWTVNSGWRQQSLPHTAKRVYGVCRLKDEKNDNWLRSPFVARRRGVSLHVELHFTMRECRNYPNPTELRHCGDTLGLYYREADAAEPPPSAWSDAVYKKETVIAPDRKWLDSSDKGNHMNVRVVRIKVAREGMYLALRDTGSCTAVYRVRLFFKECPDRLLNFTHFPATAAGHRYDVVDVPGRCVRGAGLAGKASLSFCKADGSWHDADRAWCRCRAGFEPRGRVTCQKCPRGSAKLASGPHLCVPCPANSHSAVEGALVCTCRPGFFRNPRTDAAAGPCTRPPSSPRLVRILKKSDSEVVLAWNDPDNFGGRSDLRYYITCSRCETTVVFKPSGQFRQTNVSITGLSPSTHYRFTIHAANGVSEVAGTDSRASAHYVDLQTDPRMSNKIVTVQVNLLTARSIYVSWKRPSLLAPGLVKYELRFCSLGPTRTCNLYYASSESYRINNLSEDTPYTIQVRVQTSSGYGEFSNLLTVKTRKNGSSMTDQKGQWPSEHVLYVVIPCIVVIICIAVAAAYFFNRRRSDTSSVEESITPYSNIIFSPPAETGKFYVDPHTYEDLTDAIRDFTQEIDSSWVMIENVIGGGEFGDVCRGILTIPGRYSEVVAIKTLKFDANEKSRSDFLLEASIMGQFRHYNVIRLIGVVTKMQPTMIITEYMQNGSLDKYLKTKELCARARLGLLRGVACGMSYLASMGFVHRDLAARNILVDREGTCKVSDFGLSRVLEADTSDGAYFTRGGKIPVRWTAPEAINFRKYTSSSDVWSFGIVAWEVFTAGERPYWDWTNHEVIQSVNNGFRLPMPEACPPDVYRLMLDCWDVDRLARPNFPTLVSRIDLLVASEIRERPPAKPPASGVPVLCPYTTVDDWLRVIGLERYVDIFRLHGIYFLSNGYQLTADVLLKMGVCSLEDRLTVLHSVEAARICISGLSASEGCFV